MSGLLKDNAVEPNVKPPRSIITHSTIVLGSDNNASSRSLDRGITSKTYKTSEWGQPGEEKPQETFGKKNSAQSNGFQGKKMFAFGTNMGQKQRGMHTKQYEASASPPPQA